MAMSTSGILSHGTFVATTFAIASVINRVVSEPYVDEIFHIPQAQAYCRGEWNVWDPKLTTPPGLYIPVTLLHRIAPSLVPCSLSVLRGTNLVLVCLSPLLMGSLMAKKRDGMLSDGVTLSLFPLYYFLAFLFYTDVASTLTVLLCYRLALSKHHVISALAGLLSLSFRQTNVLWVGFTASQAFRQEFGSDKADGLYDPPLKNASPADIVTTTASVGSIMLRKPVRSIRVLLPYASVLLAFGGFLIWNGGIVMGDKERHMSRLHIPQAYYGMVMTAFFTWPSIIGRASFQTVQSVVASPTRLLLFVLACLAILLSIHLFTYEHPFILADNRHYAFYIWKRFFRFRTWQRYVYAPIYALTAMELYRALGNWTMLPFMAFVAASVLSTVPSPLIEPRYFITTFFIYRLHLSDTRPVADLVWFAVINAVTLWVFLNVTFTWESEDGLMRFMW